MGEKPLSSRNTRKGPSLHILTTHSNHWLNQKQSLTASGSFWSTTTKQTLSDPEYSEYNSTLIPTPLYVIFAVCPCIYTNLTKTNTHICLLWNKHIFGTIIYFDYTTLHFPIHYITVSMQLNSDAYFILVYVCKKLYVL